MKHLVEFSLADNSTFMAEVDTGESETGWRQAGRSPSDLSEKAAQSFDAALDKIKPAAEAVIDKLRKLSDEPDEIEVEFGIKLGAEAGAFVASASAEANYKVTLKWKKH